MDPATFGLQEGKPYDGTHLDFLICCAAAPQFASAAFKGAEEFTAMTGISVAFGDVPFGSFQEQLYLEASNPNTEYDIVAYVDAWGTNIYDYLHPLNDFVVDAGIDWDDYGPAYQSASTGNSDTIYGLPFRGHPLLLHYRADVLEAVGADVPTTWQELSEVSQAIVDSGMDIAPISMYYGLNVDQNLFNWYSHLWGAGTDIFDENWEPIFNNEIGLAATEQYASYVRDGYSPAASVAWNEQEANQELIQGPRRHVCWLVVDGQPHARRRAAGSRRQCRLRARAGLGRRRHCILRLLVAGGHLGRSQTLWMHRLNI